MDKYHFLFPCFELRTNIFTQYCTDCTAFTGQTIAPGTSEQQ